MKIVHTLFSSGFAGSERSTAEACNAQTRAGHEVLLIVRRGHRGRAGASILDHIDAGVQVAIVPNRLFTGRALGKAIEAFAPDLIHTHLRRSTRLVVKLAPRAATIATLHLHVNGADYLKLDGLICNAHWQKRDIPADYPGLVFKMNNSLVPHPRLSPDERLALRRELGVADDEFLVGGVGRLARSKGWDTLLRAFAQAALPGSRLILFGEGRERRQLEKLAPPNAALPGHRSDIKRLYQAFDVFVCPSRYEPLPRTMLEAYDAGTPVIASSADGCHELISDYGGDQFPIDDVDALAALLGKHHRERPPRTQVDLSAHHIDAVTQAYLAAYEAVIAAKRERSTASLSQPE
jgi:glycosyltransferase involved in cell wall biosynthesis